VAHDLTPQLGNRFLAEPLPSPPGWWQVGSLLGEGFFVQPHLWALQMTGASPLLSTADSQPTAWELPVGRGRVTWAGLSPWFMAWGLEGPLFLRAMTELACFRAGIPYAPRPALDVRRGPCRLVYAFADYTVPGDYLDLLHHELRIEHSPLLRARQYRMLYDLSAASTGPGLVYSGAVISGLKVQGRKLKVTLEGPEGCLLATALRIPSAPKEVSVQDEEGGTELLSWSAYDSAEGILRLGHRSPRTRASLEVEW